MRPTTTIQQLKTKYREIQPLADIEDIVVMFNAEEMKVKKDQPDSDKLSGYGIAAGSTYRVLLVWKDSEKAIKAAADAKAKADKEAAAAAAKAEKEAAAKAAKAEKEAAEKAA